jgi:hypothetical protein
MGPLFLVSGDQKRVQYYSFLRKNPNDFSLNHMRINLNIAMAFIEGVENTTFVLFQCQNWIYTFASELTLMLRKKLECAA